MESWEAIAISQALRLGQFWHACNMPLTAHRHVNGKPLKIGINWRKFVPFHPLDLQKTEKTKPVSTRSRAQPMLRTPITVGGSAPNKAKLAIGSIVEGSKRKIQPSMAPGPRW